MDAKTTIELNNDEKKYLWGKIEYKKKKQAIDKKNDLFILLNEENKNQYSVDEIKIIIKGLEFLFKKKLNGIDSSINKDVFINIKNKINSIRELL